MANDRIEQVKAEAKQEGIAWGDLRNVAQQIRREEKQKREHANEVRQTAWHCVTAHRPRSWPFWRHGFLARWGHRIAKGQDYTCIPRYDLIAQEVASAFPEYDTDDGTDRLFDLLLSPYDRLPSAADIYAMAFERLYRMKRAGCYPQPSQPALPPF